MRRDDLERHLNNGYELGFVKHTGDSEYLGWILLRKRKPNERALSLLDRNEEPEYRAQQEFIRSRPYQLRLIELRRDVIESEREEEEQDYRLNEVYFFPTLDNVEDFIKQFGHTLENIKWRVDINAP